MPRAHRLLALLLQVATLAPVTAQAQPNTVGTRTAAADASTRVSPDRAEFAIRFYRQLSVKPGNVFASPYSLEMALAMAQAGAAGNTAGEFAALLGRDPAAQPANADGNGLTFAVANALWAQKGFSPDPAYVSTIGRKFAGTLQTLDFAHAPNAAADTINAWALAKTHGRIGNVINPVGLKPETRLILTDAVYFKGAWETPFSPSDTRKAEFHSALATDVQTDTMHLTDSFPLYRGQGFKLLVLPFKGGSEPVQMVIILPDAIDGLTALEASLTLPALTRWIDGAKDNLVTVALPKFTQTDALRLGDTVAAMGLSQAFSPTLANFSGVAPQTRQRLYISAVLQKTFVDLDETGTEASAVTIIEMETATARAPVVIPQPIPFIADHPFLYLIRDAKTGDILFIGRMAKPA